jgi:phosphoserine aminotransferase
MDYSVLAKANSLYNTPPMFPMYVALLVLRHFEALGGMPVLAALNGRKARKVYAVLEYGEQKGAVRMRVNDGHRSHMNVTFEVLGEGEEARFVSEAIAKGFRGIKGHRYVNIRVFCESPSME